MLLFSVRTESRYVNLDIPSTVYLHVILALALLGGFTPRPLYAWSKVSQYPVNRRLGGSRSWLGRFVGAKNLMVLLKISDSSVFRAVA